MIAEDPKAVLLGVERMARSGRDPAQFARDLLAHLRHLLVIQTIGEVPETFVITASDEGRLTAQAAAIGAATLVRTIDELAAVLTAVREGDDARMAVEIALLKAARPDLDPSAEGLLRRVERLEKGDAGGGEPRVLSEVRVILQAESARGTCRGNREVLRAGTSSTLLISRHPRQTPPPRTTPSPTSPGQSSRGTRPRPKQSSRRMRPL